MRVRFSILLLAIGSLGSAQDSKQPGKFEARLDFTGKPFQIGTTMVAVMSINDDGRVREFRAISPLGKSLDRETLEAIAKLRFKPPVKDTQQAAPQSK